MKRGNEDLFNWEMMLNNFNSLKLDLGNIRNIGFSEMKINTR